MARKKIHGFDIHPAAAVFPLLDGAELKALADDIRKNGLVEPVVVHKGEILDGRNRLVACERVGVDPRIVAWDGNGSPTAWVVSKNLHRRHLTASQRAMVGEKLLGAFEAEAKERQREQARANQPQAKKSHRQKVERIPPSEKAKAREQAAAAVNVNPRYISDAKRIRREAPEVADRVERGEVSLPAAKREMDSHRRDRDDVDRLIDFLLQTIRGFEHHAKAARAIRAILADDPERQKQVEGGALKIAALVHGYLPASANTDSDQPPSLRIVKDA